MKIKRIIWVSLLITLSLWGAGPEYDAEYQFKRIDHTLNTDGSSEYLYHSKVKLNTYRAVSRVFGESFISYDPNFQSLEILLSRTTMKDGKVVDSPKNAFNEVLPRAAKGFTPFAHLREMVVTHVGLERGAVIEFKYKLKTKPGFYANFSGWEPLGTSYPMGELQIRVETPTSKAATFFVSKYKDLLKTVTKNNKTITSIDLKNIKKLRSEPLDRGAGLGIFAYSTAKTWEKTGTAKFFPTQLPERLIKKGWDKISEAGGNFEKLRRIQQLIVSEMDHCRLGYALSGGKTRPVSEVVSSNWGTGKEKAILFSALIRKLGLDAAPVALLKKGMPGEKIIHPLLIDGYYVKVNEYCSRPVYLNPVRLQSGFIPAGSAGANVYNFASRKIEDISPKPYENDGISIEGELTLGTKKKTAALQVTLSGRQADQHLAVSAPKKLFKKVLRKVFGSGKMSSFTLLHLSHDSVKARLEMKEIKLNKLTCDTLSINAVPVNISRIGINYQKNRTHPLFLDSLPSVEMNLRVTLNKPVKPVYTVADSEVKNELGMSRFKVKNLGDNRYLLHHKFQLKRARVTADQYPLLKALGLHQTSSPQLLLMTKH